MQITSKHLKSARVWLDWSQKDLAGHSGVSLPTIQRMEATESGPVRSKYESLVKVSDALEQAGIEFIDEMEFEGVQLKRPDLLE